jgi:hypothetical protein
MRFWPRSAVSVCRVRESAVQPEGNVVSSGTSSNDPDRNADDAFAGQSFNASIDMALATIQESQVALSHMADAKANIMITVTSILLTLTMTRFEQGSFVLPSVVFATFCVPALIFAVLCVMPSAATREKPIGRDGLLRNFNPLFFMHFTLVPLKRYEREVEHVLTDPASLYRGLVRDIYYAGLVLRVKKYRYLRWSYISLLIGVLTGSIALLVSGASLIS